MSNYIKIILPVGLLVSVLLLPLMALAAESATLAMETEALDLETGAVLETHPDMLAEPAGEDVKFAYNADYTPHAVAFSAAEGVTMAFLDDMAFDWVTAADIGNLSFSSEPVDLPLEDYDTVVVRTATGAVFKLGNAVEDDSSVTFDYAQLQ